MKITAVISEYNPFHNGHRLQLDNIKEELESDYTVCLMSGDFVERGEPAIYSKETRVRAALASGADAVFLLPVPYSTGGAELFARGSVSLLNKLNAMDSLVFGSECGDIEVLRKCADDIKGSEKLIYDKMSGGLTYAEARASLFPEYSAVLSCPNNILAVEYIKAIIATASSIRPYTFLRNDNGYDSNILSKTSWYSSATAIRTVLKDNRLKDIVPYVPETAFKLYEKETPVSLNSFSNELFYAMKLNIDSLEKYLDVSPDLKNRINNTLYSYDNAENFLKSIKTRNYTQARIQRALTHILLDIKGTQQEYINNLDSINGIRLLGFKKESTGLISELSKRSGLKIVTCMKDMEGLNEETKGLFEKDIFASELYRSKNKDLTPEFSQKLIVV